MSAAKRTIRATKLLGAALVLACTCAAGPAPPTLFPPAIHWDEDLLSRHREPPLWTGNSLSDYRSRLRISIDGVNRLKVIVRIDQLKSGRYEGHFISDWKGDNGLRPREDYDFEVSRNEMAGLLALARTNDLLVQPLQSWAPDDELCTDGQDVLIEAVDQRGYRAAGGNIPCAASEGFAQLAVRLLEIADARDAARQFGWQ